MTEPSRILSPLIFEKMLEDACIRRTVKVVDAPVFSVDNRSNLDSSKNSRPVAVKTVTIDGIRTPEGIRANLVHREFSEENQAIPLFTEWFKSFAKLVKEKHTGGPLYFYKNPELITYFLATIDPMTYEMRTFEAQPSLLNGISLDLEKPVFTLNDVKKTQCADVVARLWFQGIDD